VPLAAAPIGHLVTTRSRPLLLTSGRSSTTRRPRPTSTGPAGPAPIPDRPEGRRGSCF